MNLSLQLEEYDYIKAISNLSEECGEDVYLIGGFVRDMILNRTRNEMDFLIVGDGPVFARKLAKILNVKEVTIYKNFGTAHFMYKEMADRKSVV